MIIRNTDGSPSYRRRYRLRAPLKFVADGIHNVFEFRSNEIRTLTVKKKKNRYYYKAFGI